MQSGVGTYYANDRYRSQEEQWDSKSSMSNTTHHSQSHLTQYEMSQVRDQPPLPTLPYHQQVPGYPPRTPGAYGPGSLPYSRPTLSPQHTGGGWSNARDQLMKRRVSNDLRIELRPSSTHSGP